ncbi:MAG: HEAT repeat domain-containing protein [Acidobacteriaceae bacterium]|nr:HEAT repeat domain-containing protein [Acidobacteriaceae bacterium]
MTKIPRSVQGVRTQHAYWILAMCLILLSRSALLGAEQTTADKAWAILDAGVHDAKPDKRSLAVSALGLMPGDNKATEMADRALQDTDPDVRRAAITALADMDAKSALPKIKDLINSADGKTILVIAAALKKFNDPEAYDIYYQILTGKRQSGGSIFAGVKDRKAMEAMGVQTAIGFIPFSGVGTGAYNYFRKNSAAQSSINVLAVSALAEDPDRDPSIGKALVQSAFNDKDVVQVAALVALAKRGDPSVVNDIEPAMSSGKPAISQTAAATILHLLDVRAKQLVEAKAPVKSTHKPTRHKTGPK